MQIILEKLEIILDTCEAGSVSTDFNIQKRSKLLKNKAMGLKFSLMENHIDENQMKAVDFLIQTWTKESLVILKLNPYTMASHDSNSDISN